MNADTLLENFKVLAEAPNGIDRIRELVLSLGTRIGFGVDIQKSPKQKLTEVSHVSWGNLSLTKTSYVEDGQFLAISAAGPDGRIGHAEHDKFTPVISAIGARCGTMFMPDEKFTAIKNTMTVTPDKKKIDNWYLYYALKGSQLPRRGTAQPFLSKTDIENFEITVPSSLGEQQIIVAKVDELMALCEKLEQQQQQRDNLRTAARESAINAISTAQTQEELDAAWKRINNNWEVIADTPESIDHLRSLVINLGVQGQLFSPQKIGTDGYPVSWKTRKFTGYCDIEGGSQPPKNYFVNELKPDYVRLFQIRDLGTNPVPVFIPRSMAKSFSVVGDVLIGRYGASVGKVFRAQDGAYNVALVKFVFPKEDLMTDFVFWMLQSSRIQAIFSGMSRSAQAGFNKRDLAGLNVPIPEMKEQKQIVAKINELMVLCDQLEAELKVRSEVAEKFARSILEVA